MFIASHKYPKKWINIVSLEKQDFRDIALKNFEQPFLHLPISIILSSDEVKLLNKLENQKGWATDEFILLRSLQLKEGKL